MIILIFFLKKKKKVKRHILLWNLNYIKYYLNYFNSMTIVLLLMIHL